MIRIVVDTDAAAAVREALASAEPTAVWVGTGDEPELAEFEREVTWHDRSSASRPTHESST